MKLIKSFVIAFLLFSKVPMPQLKLKEEDMEYMFIFFPLVGAVIGGIIFGWNYLCRQIGLSDIPRVLITAVIPLIITGGIHLDGYMDCMDAFNSYRDREDMLRILKDPHIGAFSVIKLLIYAGLFVSALFCIEKRHIGLFVISFFVSRCFSGLAAMTIVPAKTDGMLRMFYEASKRTKNTVITALILMIASAFVLMVKIDGAKGIIFALLAVYIWTFIDYRAKCLRLLGGINGDTEGWFLCKLELLGALTIAIFCIGGF